MQKICQNCGHSMTTDDNFCEKCGAPLHEKAEAIREEIASKKVDFFYTEENRMNRLAYLFSSYNLFAAGVVTMIGLGLLYIILLVMGFFFRSNIHLFLSFIAGLTGFAFAIYFLVISFKAAKRRLHDLNLSARWMLPYIVIFLGGAIWAVHTQSEKETEYLIFEGIMMIPLLLLYLLPGKQTKNKYGEPYSKKINRTNFFYLDQQRIGRKEFIWGNAKAFVLPSVVSIARGYFSGGLDTAMLMISYPGRFDFGQLFTGISVLVMLLGILLWGAAILFTFFLGTKLRMRRLQDFGLNKNLVYIPLGIIILEIILSITAGTNGTIIMVGGIIVLLFELFCLCIKGKSQANSYGLPYHDMISETISQKEEKAE